MIYILAQGKGSRWYDHFRHEDEYDMPSEYKQLIPVNGEPNLFRTIRMLEDCGRDDYLVIAEGSMFTPEQVDSLPNKIKTLRHPGNILHGVWQLLDFSQENIFLLGDVIFSEQAIADIVAYDEREYTLWGRFKDNIFTGKQAGEIFALTVSKEFTPLVKKQLSTIKLLQNKLWGFYHHYLFSGNWAEVDDWTDDIDSPNEYFKFFPMLEKLAL
jgi:hypothetical protein